MQKYTDRYEPPVTGPDLTPEQRLRDLADGVPGEVNVAARAAYLCQIADDVARMVADARAEVVADVEAALEGSSYRLGDRGRAALDKRRPPGP